MGISSLVSYSVLDICEVIPGMQNAVYRIPATDGKTPAIFHVGDTFYYKPNAMDEQDLIHVSSEEVVKSIEHMYRTSQIVYDSNAYPALIAIPNVAITSTDLSKSPYDQLVKDALRKQRNWFLKLVEMADNDYAQYRRPQVVSELQRIASRHLNLKRTWSAELQDEGAKPDCAFCGTDLINPNAPICPNCKQVINQAAYDALKKKVETMMGQNSLPKANA